MTEDLVAVASYGGSGAWAAAELDVAFLGSVGIRAVVSGDAHHHSPLFTGHQVALLVSAGDRAEAIGLLGVSGSVEPGHRRLADHGPEDR